jgi:hypothetical protein
MGCLPYGPLKGRRAVGPAGALLRQAENAAFVVEEPLGKVHKPHRRFLMIRLDSDGKHEDCQDLGLDGSAYTVGLHGTGGMVLAGVADTSNSGSGGDQDFSLLRVVDGQMAEPR